MSCVREGNWPKAVVTTCCTPGGNGRSHENVTDRRTAPCNDRWAGTSIGCPSAPQSNQPPAGQRSPPGGSTAAVPRRSGCQSKIQPTVCTLTRRGELHVSPDLAYDVFITEPIPQNVAETTPNGDRLMRSPLSSTMIHGEHDAVLVDPPFTLEQGRAVGDWIETTNKNLTHIFVTHGHGDHWFAAGLIAERFNAGVVATVGTIEQMHRNVAAREMVWDRIFPNQIPETTVTVTSPQNG